MSHIGKAGRKQLKMYKKNCNVFPFDDGKSAKDFEKFTLIEKIYSNGTEIPCYRCGTNHVVSNGKFIGYPACSKCSEIILTQRRMNALEQTRQRERNESSLLYKDTLEKLLTSPRYKEARPIEQASLTVILYDLYH